MDYGDHAPYGGNGGYSGGWGGHHVLDAREIFLRFFKYVFQGLVLATVAYFYRKLDAEEIMILALTAAAVFALLDFFIPSMGASARTGAGLGIGMNLVGFPGGAAAAALA